MIVHLVRPLLYRASHRLFKVALIVSVGGFLVLSSKAKTMADDDFIIWFSLWAIAAFFTVAFGLFSRIVR